MGCVIGRSKCTSNCNISCMSTYRFIFHGFGNSPSRRSGNTHSNILVDILFFVQTAQRSQKRLIVFYRKFCSKIELFDRYDLNFQIVFLGNFICYRQIRIIAILDIFISIYLNGKAGNGQRQTQDQGQHQTYKLLHKNLFLS